MDRESIREECSLLQERAINVVCSGWPHARFGCDEDGISQTVGGFYAAGLSRVFGLRDVPVTKSKESLQPQSSDDTWVDWVSQVAQGDESALAHLYDASSRLVYGLALRILGEAGAAEEVTLDVYLQVWRQANRFDPARGRVST